MNRRVAERAGVGEGGRRCCRSFATVVPPYALFFNILHSCPLAVTTYPAATSYRRRPGRFAGIPMMLQKDDETGYFWRRARMRIVFLWCAAAEASPESADLRWNDRGRAKGYFTDLFHSGRPALERPRC